MNQQLPPQHQNRQPGIQGELHPQPKEDDARLHSARRFEGKTLVVTGGDSGIGRAVALGAAREGANVAFVYLNEDKDAKHAEDEIRSAGAEVVSFKGDVGDENFCRSVIERVVERFGALHVLVNDAGEQHPQPSITEITADQLERTFRTNVFGYFFMAKAAVPHLREGSSIVNIASVTAYEGNPMLIDYSSTKGAIVSFTRALSNALVGEKKIRVNAVAPGPIWTPLIPASFPAEKVKEFGSDTPMKRPGQPSEVAAAVLFLASDQASYISGQTLHVNGGTVVNS